MIMALIDSGSGVNLLSNTSYQQLGKLNHIRVYNKNIKAANIGKIPVKWSKAFHARLQKFTSEINVVFLVT